MSGILYGALLPRDVVLGLDNSTREPTCHSSPYLGQFMLLRKLAEPFSDLLLGAILSKLCSGCIRKALSFNFPNLWKLAAWEWIERISRENCAHGYRCNFLLASSDLFWAADHAFQGVCKSVLPSGAWSERCTDFEALYETTWWTGLRVFLFRDELSRKKILLHVNREFTLNLDLYESAGTECCRGGKSIRFNLPNGHQIKTIKFNTNGN